MHALLSPGWISQIDARLERQEREGRKRGDEERMLWDQAPEPGLQERVPHRQDHDLVGRGRGLA